MDPVFITGATGLIGANVCKLLVEGGTKVRALVRPNSETDPLAALGVELVWGDVTSADDIRRGAEGTAAIVNSAALLGGADQDMAASIAANHRGSINCYDAGRDGGQRVVEIITTTFLRHDQPLTERPGALSEEEAEDDPYTVSKGRAFRDGLARVEDGQDIVFVTPGGTFGPSPVPKRALSSTSFNRLVRAALRGRLTDYVAYPVPWVRAEDVAQAIVASISAGESGLVYLAFGAEDARTTADFLNLACEVAGVDHRIENVVIAPDDPGAVERYGETVSKLAQRTYPVPWFDNSVTRSHLAYAPVPLRDGLAETVAWLRAIGEAD